MTSLSSRAYAHTYAHAQREIIPSSLSSVCEEAVSVRARDGGNHDLEECVMQNFVHAIRQGLAAVPGVHRSVCG